ncbi:hypothetical protein HBI06_051190 [Parastagonospora nodorum]|nr:hypothetical protein HBI09_108990 [Parastagonospora nodorum]KAH4236760.1 hypothetical protein HBI06_051190 [Parastagonospora nodorum]KAH4248591.1 hypothetical protein HBI05_021530 [Parastagonospora nodorum]KAH5040166.1 hypothetical protein HBI74_028270 [Parastagonospora nodorum]KAH5547265.1 hypothetical protein HBI27_039110 [Parastagonospora nodorum]
MSALLLHLCEGNCGHGSPSTPSSPPLQSHSLTVSLTEEVARTFSVGVCPPRHSDTNVMQRCNAASPITAPNLNCISTRRPNASVRPTSCPRTLAWKPADGFEKLLSLPAAHIAQFVSSAKRQHMHECDASLPVIRRWS